MSKTPKSKTPRVRARGRREVKAAKPQTEIPIDQVLREQFAKVGQLQWQIDMMRRMMTALENENKELKEQLKQIS